MTIEVSGGLAPMPTTVAPDTAFAARLEELRPRMRSYAQGLARDRAAADDLVQETFLRAWAARTRFEEGSNLQAWIYTILRNLFLTGRRRLKTAGDYSDAIADRILAAPPNQEAHVELGDLQRAIAMLPEDQQDALNLIVFEQVNYAAAAIRLGVAEGTVKSRLSRARATLGDFIEGRRTTIAPLRRAKRPSRHVVFIG